MVLRGVVRLELVVVSEVHELVRVGAAAQVARLVRGLHVVVQRALVVEALAAAEFTRGVARERPEGLVHLPRGAVVVAVELRSGVQELLRDEHLAPLHARVAVVELVLLPEVRAELLEARVVRHALRDPAVGRHARGALQTAELLHPAPHRAVVEEDVERLVAPELAARDAPRQRLEPGLPAERLRVRPDGRVANIRGHRCWQMTHRRSSMTKRRRATHSTHASRCPQGPHATNSSGSAQITQHSSIATRGAGNQTRASRRAGVK